MGDPFDAFIKEMLNAKQWSTAVDDEVKQQLEADLKNRLMDQIDRAVIEAMPEDKVNGLNELLDREASEDEVRHFIQQSGVDTQRVTLETMLRFRDLYLENPKEQ